MKIHSYLTFNGNCWEAFKFYEKEMGGKIGAHFTYEGSPMADKFPPEWKDKMLHANIQIGETVVMGSDAPPPRYRKPEGIHLSIAVKDPAEAERLFHILAEGGIVEMPIAETFWAVRFGMLTDRFGIPWMINCENSK